MSKTAVFLHGHLAEKYGERFDLFVNSVAEAISLMRVNFPEFEHDVIGHEFNVWVGKSNLGEEELRNPTRGQDIHIIPTVGGAGTAGRIILGVVLIIIGIVYGIYTEDWGDAYKIMELGAMQLVGVALSYIFAPSKNLGSLSAGENGKTLPSYAFGGAVNTAAQGNPVPVLYGRLVVGSQVISAGISSA